RNDRTEGEPAGRASEPSGKQPDQSEADKGRDQRDITMRKMDDVEYPEQQAEPDGDQRVDAGEHRAVDEKGDDIVAHADTCERSSRRTAASRSKNRSQRTIWSRSIYSSG